MATLERGQSTLLQDLYEKKQNLRRIASEVGSMATELRDVRMRMAAQESNIEQETARRQAAKAKAEAMEEELRLLQRSWEEKNAHAASTASVAEQYLRELVEVRVRLGSAQEAADSNAAAAAKAESQCAALMKELQTKNEALQEHDARVAKLNEQLAGLQVELKARDTASKQLKDEVQRLEAEMVVAVARVSAKKDLEMRNALEELSMKDAQQLSKHLNAKDEEIARMREEVKLLSAQVRMRAQELEIQVEKHRAADQDLKKRILKLEFWLQEARAQSRKLQRIADKREKDLKDLQAQVASNPNFVVGTPMFWAGKQRLKVLISLTVVVLALFSRR